MRGRDSDQRRRHRPERRGKLGRGRSGASARRGAGALVCPGSCECAPHAAAPQRQPGLAGPLRAGGRRLQPRQDSGRGGCLSRGWGRLRYVLRMRLVVRLRRSNNSDRLLKRASLCRWCCGTHVPGCRMVAQWGCGWGRRRRCC
jgi:hypothetical protein